MTGYWIRQRERFVEIPKATKVVSGDLDLFVHSSTDSSGGFTVTEGRSGFSVFTAPKRKAAIGGAKARVERMGISKILESIDSCVSNSGLSPRYGGEVEVGVASDPYMDMIIKNKKTLQTYSNVFESIFKVRLQNFWSNLHGFEVTKFDDQVIMSGDGCMSAKVIEVYGEEATKLIRTLLA